MAATAADLRELHGLHQRAKALRDRLISGPKTVAVRQAALANRQAALETSRKALQDARVQLKKKEHTVQSINARIDDRKVKLNTVKKNEEYKAIQNEIAQEKNQIDKIEVGDEITLEMPYATFTYEVTKTDIVDPSDVEIVDDVGHERLVLTACHPLYSAAQRYAVFADLDEITLFPGGAGKFPPP